MTREELQEILDKSPEDILKDLKKSSFTIPDWTALEKQYNPMKHKIWDKTAYPAKPDEKQNDDFKRTAYGLQELAVSRMSQAMFSRPVTRLYNFDETNESQKKAIDILEQLYRVENFIDSSNLERAVMVNASCQMVTVWKAFEHPLRIENEDSKFILSHSSYSAMEGYEIYVRTDENDVILYVYIAYKDEEDKEKVDIYVNGGINSSELHRFEKIGEWDYVKGYPKKDLFPFPVVHTWIKEPVWKGDAGTNLVEGLEEQESYQGMYIKRNSLPTFTLDYGENPGTVSTSEESSSDSRRIIVVGKGGAMKDVTWAGAGDAVESRHLRLRNAFFESAQIPDISFANLLNSNTSAENKTLLFTDSKARAKQLGGAWEKLFHQELKIVLEFAKVMFPKYKEAFNSISVRSEINPYSVNTKKDTAEYISLAGGSMSQSTKVRLLGEVDNVDEEVQRIEAENSVNANQGLL